MAEIIKLPTKAEWDKVAVGQFKQIEQPLDYMAKMILDSVNIETGDRLSTIHVRLPWYITPEILRHRQFSFSSRSTRAVPTTKMLEEVRKWPAIPPHIGKNKRGMQATEQLHPDVQMAILAGIEKQGRLAADFVQWLNDMGLHKQVANKYLMPWLWCDILISSTTWANFLALRTHEAAAPEMQIIAGLIADALVESEPQKLVAGDWHMPFIDLATAPPDLDTSWPDFKLLKCSAARIARISVKNFEDGTINWAKDLDLGNMLATSVPMHASPMEHVAQAIPKHLSSRLVEGDYIHHGNFAEGWCQMRHMLPRNTTTKFVWKDKEIV